MKTIAIIPARGGSKGIPRKNVRFLAGKPLISYSITNALNCELIDHVVVSTDDDEIAHISKIYGAEVLMRGRELSDDVTTLDPVVYHALKETEKKNRETYDFVITLQATSPLLTENTITKAIKKFREKEVDNLLTVTDSRHLSWTKKEGKFVPNYKERLNRQYLPPNFLETGGILISRRDCITPESRFGEKIDLLEIDSNQAVDIDSEMDWWVAEKLLKRKKIIIRVDGYDEIGLGHVYRTLLIANRMIDHNVLFLMQKKYKIGIDLIQSHNYKIALFNNSDEFYKIIRKFSPDIIINDILDTTEDYVKKLKKEGLYTVNFEDLGEGAKYADIVFNALYEEKYPLENHFWGKNYYCLREEFFLLDEIKKIKNVNNILVTFGGTDNNDYTSRVIKIIDSLEIKLNVTVILGLGYKKISKLKKITNKNIKIEIMQNVKNISKYMQEADLAITSAGRTIYELASVKTPTIVIAQNSRELTHTFASQQNGIINLGLGYEINDKEIAKTIKEMIDNQELRERCSSLMKKTELKNGIFNVINTILDNYKQFEENK